MVTGDNDLDRMWLGAEPGERVLEFMEGSRLCEITGMDENISIWNTNLRAMSVRNADNRNGTCDWRSWDGFAPIV